MPTPATASPTPPSARGAGAPPPRPPAPLGRPADVGPEDTVERLVERFTRPALALARRILADDGLAEDVVQEVFVALWRDRGSFDPSRGSFGSWVLSAVHHKAVDAVRREEAHRRRVGRAAALLDVPGALSADPAELASQRVEHAHVSAALAALPGVQREALTLAYYGGYSQQQIALRTGAPLGTVKTRMLAGMRTLRRRLAEPA